MKIGFILSVNAILFSQSVALGQEEPEASTRRALKPAKKSSTRRELEPTKKYGRSANHLSLHERLKSSLVYSGAPPSNEYEIEIDLDGGIHPVMEEELAVRRKMTQETSEENEGAEQYSGGDDNNNAELRTVSLTVDGKSQQNSALQAFVLSGRKIQSSSSSDKSSEKSTKAPTLKSSKAPTLKSSKSPTLKSSKSSTLKSSKSPTLKSSKSPTLKSSEKKSSDSEDSESYSVKKSKSRRVK